MKSVILLGPPGVGKGTQCALLSSRLGFAHVSTGALIRGEISSGSALGLRVKDLVESGSLVDDPSILACFESFLSSGNLNPSQVVLIDGIPRNKNQANLLDKLLSKQSYSASLVISLEADMDALVERFSKRWTCSQCSNVASFGSDVDPLDMQCVHCSSKGLFFRRKDDEPQTVRKRFEIYEEQKNLLLSHYSQNIFKVNGLLPAEQVYASIVYALVSNKLICTN